MLTFLKDGDESDKESIMTDGCGWMNYTALQQSMLAFVVTVSSFLKLSSLEVAIATNSNFPVVVQGRIGGAKGLWVLHPAEEHRSPDEPPKIVRQTPCFSEFKIKAIGCSGSETRRARSNCRRRRHGIVPSVFLILFAYLA